MSRRNGLSTRNSENKGAEPRFAIRMACSPTELAAQRPLPGFDRQAVRCVQAESLGFEARFPATGRRGLWDVFGSRMSGRCAGRQ